MDTETPICDEDKVIEGLQGTVLEGNVTLQALLRHDKHAAIYSVEGPQTTDLLARVYNLRNISKQLRQYRLRNLKRNSGPNTREFRCQGFVVLLCRYDDKRKATTNTHTSTAARQSDIAKTTVAKPGRKSIICRESARIRQLEKRRTQRRNKANARVQASLDKCSSSKQLQDFNDEDTFCTVALLYVGFTGNSEILSSLPPASRDAIEEYLDRDALKFKFDDIQQLESFLKLKRQESIFLNKQLRQLPEMIERRREHFSVLLESVKSVASLPGASELRKNIVEKARVAERQLKVVETVRDDALPKFIGDVKKACRDLEKRLQRTRKLKAKIDDRQNMEWGKILVPGSAVYGQGSSKALGPAKPSLEPLEVLRDRYLALLDLSNDVNQ